MVKVKKITRLVATVFGGTLQYIAQRGRFSPAYWTGDTTVHLFTEY